MSNSEAQSDDTEALGELVRTALKEELAGFGHDFGLGEPLNEMTPADGVEKYLEEVRQERSQGTYETHRSRTSFFVKWCDIAGIEHLKDLNGKHLMEFRDWRREESGWEMTTEKHQMQTLRKFLRFAAKPGWVPESLPEKVPVPTVDPEDETRDTIIRQHQVDEILEYLERFEYARLEHCVWLVMGRVGCRISGFLALDVRDYEPDDETGKAILKFRNRPETGTRLKNGYRSERNVEVPENVRQVIDDYLEHQRPDVTDDHGREPLFASKYGRPSASTIRKYAYMWSRSCAITGNCPFDRDPSECEAFQCNDSASKCPDSVSTHPIRRGRITWHLNQGVFPQMISEMYDATPEVIKRYYDERSHSEKQQLASQWLNRAKDLVKETFGGSMAD